MLIAIIKTKMESGQEYEEALGPFESLQEMQIYFVDTHNYKKIGKSRWKKDNKEARVIGMNQPSIWRIFD